MNKIANFNNSRQFLQRFRRARPNDVFFSSFHGMTWFREKWIPLKSKWEIYGKRNAMAICDTLPCRLPSAHFCQFKGVDCERRIIKLPLKHWWISRDLKRSSNSTRKARIGFWQKAKLIRMASPVAPSKPFHSIQVQSLFIRHLLRNIKMIN